MNGTRYPSLAGKKVLVTGGATGIGAALVEGFAEGCRAAGAVWGGGETPTLKGIVHPDAIVLAGSAVGKKRRLKTSAAAVP